MKLSIVSSCTISSTKTPNPQLCQSVYMAGISWECEWTHPIIWLSQAVTYSVKNGNITFWWPEFNLPLHLWPVLHYQILCEIGLMQPSGTHSHSCVLFEKISHSLDMVWKWIVLPVVLVTAWVIHLKTQYRKHTRFWERFSTHHALRMTLESVTNPCDHSTTHAIRELVSILFPWVCYCNNLNVTIICIIIEIWSRNYQNCILDCKNG